jgi:succinate dehydrogenase/fumarate reductase cytochrome b subunit
MGVVADIGRTWRHGPAAPVREQIAVGPIEARSLVVLMAGCALVFIAQWPRLAREAAMTGAEMERLVSYALLAWLIVWPLAFYLLAGIVHLLSRLMGGRGTPAATRAALFWSWLAAAPVALLAGLTAGLVGPGLQANLVGTVWLGAFLAFGALAQREASRGRTHHAA